LVASSVIILYFGILAKLKSMLKNHEILKRPFFFTCIIAIFLLLPQGCLKDIPDKVNTDYVWEPVLAFPIGEADFGLKIPHGFDTLLLELEPITGRPYWDYLDSIPLTGSIDFDFEEVLGEREEISFGILRFNAYNGFPIEVTLEAYLEDASGSIIDTLFQPKLIMERGILSAGGETATAVLTQRDIKFDTDGLDILNEAKKITFVGKINSIPFFPNFTFKVQLGAKLGIVSQLW